MHRVAVAFAASVLAFGAGPAAASVVLGLGAPKCMNGGGCFTSAGVQTHVMNTAGSGAWQVGALTLNRALLGRHVNDVFRITFWTADGSRQVGDFGSFMIGGLLGNEVTLGGPAFAFDGAWGDMMVKLELQEFGKTGGAGGSGAPRASLPHEGAGHGGGLGNGGGSSDGSGSGARGAGGPGASGGLGAGGGIAGGGVSDEAGAGSSGIGTGHGGIGGAHGVFGPEELPGNHIALPGPERSPGDPGALVAGPSPNPEPSTWAVAILGFGLAGASLRRRRMAAKPA